MFGSVRPTEFDVAFHLFGIPIRVQPWFWILALLLGRGLASAGWPYLVVWVIVVFFSILIHELGHGLTARAFGYRPHIFLHGFGGVAMFTPDAEYTQGKSILITLAGPAAGFALGVSSMAMWFLLPAFGVTLTPLANEAFNQLFFVNIFWSILNMLPIIPLDGGQITRDICTSMNPQRGDVWALWISILVGIPVAVLAFNAGMFFGGIILLMMCAESYQALQTRRH